MPYKRFFPLAFRNLTVRIGCSARIFAGRFDTTTAPARRPDQLGSEIRSWRVGAIISSFRAGASTRPHSPNYATIVSDDRIPFWARGGQGVHEHDCKYILQLSHGGRQRGYSDESTTRWA